MKTFIKAAALSGALALAACSGGRDDQAAENVEEAAENQADMLESQADNATNETTEDRLEAKAETVEEAGDEKAATIDDNDGAANTMETENVSGM